jgi:pimeloyl-ACP methyl ester carboxylesterase
MVREKSEVLFIHGLWLHPSSWAPWLRLFDARDYEPSAPGWPGVGYTVEETRADPDATANRGIEEISDHYARIIDGMARLPVVVGHSFGGMIAQKLLGQGFATAAIALGAAQIRGGLPLPISSLRATVPNLQDPANRQRAVSLSAEQFRYSFGNALDDRESRELYERWAIPGPVRPLFEASAANFSLDSPAEVDVQAERGPLLLVTGGKDLSVPESVTRSTLELYGRSPGETDLLEFPDRGHSLTIDGGWREVAEACLTWLDKHDL